MKTFPNVSRKKNNPRFLEYFDSLVHGFLHLLRYFDKDAILRMTIFRYFEKDYFPLFWEGLDVSNVKDSFNNQ